MNPLEQLMALAQGNGGGQQNMILQAIQGMMQGGGQQQMPQQQMPMEMLPQGMPQRSVPEYGTAPTSVIANDPMYKNAPAWAAPGNYRKTPGGSKDLPMPTDTQYRDEYPTDGTMQKFENRFGKKQLGFEHRQGMDETGMSDESMLDYIAQQMGGGQGNGQPQEQTTGPQGQSPEQFYAALDAALANGEIDEKTYQSLVQEYEAASPMLENEEEEEERDTEK